MWNGDRGFRMHDAYGAGWTLMVVVVVMLAIGIAVLIALLLRPTPEAHRATTAALPAHTPEPEAEQILRRRFASGEMDEDEFRRRRAALAENSR
jgi:putative membrane protein